MCVRKFVCVLVREKKQKDRQAYEQSDRQIKTHGHMVQIHTV